VGDFYRANRRLGNVLATVNTGGTIKRQRWAKSIDIDRLSYVQCKASAALTAAKLDGNL